MKYLITLRIYIPQNNSHSMVIKLHGVLLHIDLNPIPNEIPNTQGTHLFIELLT